MMVTLNGRGSRRSMTIIDCINDPQIFGRHFRNPKSWAAWLSFLAVLFGLPIDDKQRELFQQCTGRQQPNPNGYHEAHLVVGRRGGKSFALALIAVYLAAFKSWVEYLAPGERATVMVIAADRRQARTIMRYCKGLINGTPMLRGLIERETAEILDLSNRVTIEVHTASFRSTRGYAICAGIADECAFWATDENAAEPDTEVLNALRPGMASIPESMLLCASSPYARKGALYQAFSKHFGKDDSAPLIWRAATRTMNPTIPQSVIDEAMEQDPARASAEFLAEFRSDIKSYISLDVIQACIARGVYERPYQSGLHYCAFTDPSGGSSDSFALSIAHKDADSLILDVIREIRPPFSPESVCMEFAGLMRSYRITKVTGDRYAGEWPREQFRKYGIQYEPSPQPKSDLYRDMLPLLNSRRVELLDSQRLVNQLVGLERKTSRGGRDSVDHPPNSHDDVANCVAGVITAIAKLEQRMRYFASGCGLSCEWDLRTGRKIEPEGHDPRGHLMRGEQGSTVLRAAVGANECIPGCTDASGGFHPTQSNRSRSTKGLY